MASLRTGLIVLAVVMAAAGAAAYENPQVREWVGNSRKKIAHSLYSLGDEIDPRPKQCRRNDASMREDEAEGAEERRRRARAEIIEKGRIMEERRRRKNDKKNSPVSSPSFDTLVDNDGSLKSVKTSGERRHLAEVTTAATSSADTPPATQQELKRRDVKSSQAEQLTHQSVDFPLALHQLSAQPLSQQHQHEHQHPDTFESQYEREMRSTWSLPPSNISTPPPSSAHDSESLIDLTPTSEFPDPDIVIPQDEQTIHNSIQSIDETDYFSMMSNAAVPSNTLSEANSGSPPLISPQHLTHHDGTPSQQSDHDQFETVNGEDDDDAVFSDSDDGVRTPGSAWTELDSVTSSHAE